MNQTKFTAVLIIGLMAVVQFVVLPARQRNKEFATQVRQLEERNGQLRGENAKLTRKIRALQADPYYVEYLLRERLRYTRPEEVATNVGRSGPR